MARKIAHFVPKPPTDAADFPHDPSKEMLLPPLPRSVAWPSLAEAEARLETKAEVGNKHGTKQGPQGIVRRKKNSA